jgi:hypothetical protein
MEEMVELTRENLHAGKTPKGGFRRVQVEILGVEWPFSRGWLSGLVGQKVPRSVYDRFVEAGAPKAAGWTVSGVKVKSFTPYRKRLIREYSDTNQPTLF